MRRDGAAIPVISGRPARPAGHPADKCRRPGPWPRRHSPQAPGQTLDQAKLLAVFSLIDPVQRVNGVPDQLQSQSKALGGFPGSVKPGLGRLGRIERQPFVAQRQSEFAGGQFAVQQHAAGDAVRIGVVANIEKRLFRRQFQGQDVPPGKPPISANIRTLPCSNGKNRLSVVTRSCVFKDDVMPTFPIQPRGVAAPCFTVVSSSRALPGQSYWSQRSASLAPWPPCRNLWTSLRQPRRQGTRRTSPGSDRRAKPPGPKLAEPRSPCYLFASGLDTRRPPNGLPVTRLDIVCPGRVNATASSPSGRHELPQGP